MFGKKDKEIMALQEENKALSSRLAELQKRVETLEQGYLPLFETLLNKNEGAPARVGNLFAPEHNFNMGREE